MTKVLLSLLLMLLPVLSRAQSNRLYVPHLRTLRAVVDGDWQQSPLLTLGTDSHVEISFDDLTHEFCRYTCRLVHCDRYWQYTSGLLESDYMDGFNDLPIEDYDTSWQTEQDYTHYRLTLPNKDLKILVSGNYKLLIFSDNEEGVDATVKEGEETLWQELFGRQPVAEACFSVLEPLLGVNADVTTNTDVDFNARHQQLSMTIAYGGAKVVDPLRELTPIILQNRQWSTAVKDPKPTMRNASELIYTHRPELIFPAGNEYHRFECLNTHYVTLGIDHMQFFDPLYHAFLDPDKPQHNYFYDQDQDGAYLIRTDHESGDDQLTADYVITHFTLQTDTPLSGYDLYVDGDFTQGQLLPEYRMHYQPDIQAYEALIPLKQGYYNYRYVKVPHDDGADILQSQSEVSGNLHTPKPQSVDAHFFQTSNTYEVYVYFRPVGSRYDRLAGYRRLRYAIDSH